MNNPNSSIYKYMYVCPKANHDHRKATDTEYINYNLDKYDKTGCFLCSPKILYKESSLIWSCPLFIEIKTNDLSLYSKCLLIKNLSNYLPLELIIIIIKMCKTTYYSSEITEINYNFLKHINSCNFCSINMLKMNTLETCKEHIIPRNPLRIRRKAFY